jgi:hypothetical protein
MVLAPSVTNTELAFHVRPTPFYGMRFRLRGFFLLPLFLLAGCGAATEPSPPSLEFDGQLIFGFPTLPTVATAETGGILVTGALQTPTLGYSLRGVLSSEGSRVLRLEVDAYLIEEPLPFAAQHYYRAHLKNLVRGSYDLIVVHTFLYSQVVNQTVFHGAIRVQ